MSNRIGTTILWSIEDNVYTTAAVLAANGFDDWTPRNNFSESLNKAIKTVRREWDVQAFGEANIPKRVKQAKHHRFIDTDLEARVAFTVPRINGTDFSIDVALVIILDKKTGALTFERDTASTGDFEILQQKVRDSFRVERDRINSDEFRRFVGRYATGMTGCNGIPLRPTGGVYFVPSMFDDRIAKLKAMFDQVNGLARFLSIPMMDDEETAAALEYATSETFEARMKILITKLDEDVKKGLSPRAYENRLQEVAALASQIEAFKNQTRSHAEVFETKMNNLAQIMEKNLGNVKDNVVQPFDLLAELDKIQ